MKKWQLILCSMCVSFIPTLVVAAGYTYAFVTLNLELNIIPYMPIILGAVVSYWIYKDTEKIIINK